MKPYINIYETIKDIPIGTELTISNHLETEEIILLGINKILWFEDDLDHTLINPNQC